jgi:hypothetical protein
LSERVSEVNLGDPHDIRALLAGDDAQIEVRLGERNLGTRLQRALKVLDDQRSTSMGPFITYLVASQDGKITVGHRADAPSAKAESGATESAQTASGPTEIGGRASTSVSSRNKADAPSKKDTRSVMRDNHELKQKAKQPGPQTSETRPRRVL